MVLLQVHEGLLGSGSLLGALLHQALHAAQCIAPIRHAALKCLRCTSPAAQTVLSSTTMGTSHNPLMCIINLYCQALLKPSIYQICRYEFTKWGGTCSRAAAVRWVVVWAARSSSRRASAAVTSSLNAAMIRPSLTCHKPRLLIYTFGNMVMAGLQTCLVTDTPRSIASQQQHLLTTTALTTLA